MEINKLILLLVSLMIPWTIGDILLTALFGRKYFPTNLFFAFAYGLGMGVLTQVMLILGIQKIPFSTETISLTLITCAWIVLLWSRMKKKNHVQLGSFPGADAPLSIGQKVFCFFLLIFIAYNIAYVFWRALNIPVYLWDVLATIAFKGKIFFYEKGLVPLYLLPHSSYPLHLPLLQTWVALNLGQWDDQAINIVLPFTFGAFLVIYYYFLKSFTTKTWAMLGVALLLSSFQFVFFSTVAYQELFLVYYNCTAIMLLILWQKTRVDGFLILAGLFSGFLTFTKLEGMGYLGLHSILLFLILNEQKTLPLKEKVQKLFKFMGPAGAIYLLYIAYKIFFNFPVTERTTLHFTWPNALHLGEVSILFIKILYWTGSWNIIWFVLLVSYVNLLKKGFRGEIRWLTIMLVLFFILYFLIFAFSPETYPTLTTQTLPEIVPRVILHFYPLAPLLIILLNFPARSDEDLQ